MDSRKLSMESVTRFEAQKVVESIEQVKKDARRETLEEVLHRLEKELTSSYCSDDLRDAYAACKDDALGIVQAELGKVKP